MADEHLGRLSSLDPGLERAEEVDHVAAVAVATAMAHPGHEEQAVEVLRGLQSAHHAGHRVVFEAVAFIGMMAPAATRSFTAEWMKPADFGSYVQMQVPKWGTIVKSGNVTVD